MASVLITVLLYNGSLLCGFNVPIKGLIGNYSKYQQTWGVKIRCVKDGHRQPTSETDLKTAVAYAPRAANHEIRGGVT